MDSLDFWICSLRSIANGSLILIILPRCFNDHSTSESDSKEYSNSKFRYTHNEVNLLSRWTYSWILPLLWHGYKTPIDVDVLEKVTEQEKSKIQFEKLKQIISVEGDINCFENLFRACLKMNWYVVLMGGLYRLAADICSLASALSIKWIVKSINDENKNQTEEASEKNNDSELAQSFWSSPYVIVFAIFAFSVLQGIFSQATSHFSILAGIRAKNAILVLLYEKTLALPVIKEQKQNRPTKNSDDNSDEEHNESNIDIGHVTNLATEDISNVKEILWNFHYSWALPLKIIVIGILIHARIGLAGSLSTAVGVLCIVPLQLVVGKLMSDNNKKIQEHSDRRILLSSEVIQGMKSVKLGCLEELKLNQISLVRKQELICLKKDSWLWSAMTFLASVSTLLVSVLVISLYALLEPEPFKSEDIFTTLALLNQLTVCLSVLPVTLPIYVKGFVSLRRLKTFWRQNQQSGNGTANPRENNVHKDKAIVMENATFFWPNQTEPSACQLNVEQLCIKKGTLTMVLGQKSPFFLSLLKEMKLQEGIFEWNMGEDIAFVGQRPWIINGSIKENILMGRPFKEKRYKKVLIACDLEADINILPLRDGTEVGEDGVLLSGGQRHRIAIARCLYSKASCTILDMPFSALDSNLGLHIFEHGILKILLKRKRTVIMCCQRKDFLTRADLILNFGLLGQLDDQGSYLEIKKSNPDLLKSNKLDHKSLECKTAQERWKLLKNVTKLSIGLKSKSRDQEKRSLNRGKSGLMKQNCFKRLESSAQLGFCHNIMIHSPMIDEESENTRTFLKRVRSTKMANKNLARIAIQNEHTKKHMTAELPNELTKKHMTAESRPSLVSLAGGQTSSNRFGLESARPSLSAQGSMMGFHFAHKFVSRMTSNTSQLSGISGFSDDQDVDDFEQDGLITHHDGSWEEEDREKGHIKTKVITAYFKAGGIGNFVFFLILSIGFQSTKIFSDFLLKSPQMIAGYDFLTMYLSSTAIALILSICANIFGQNLGCKARKILHKNLLEHIMIVRPYLFEMLPPSRFISRLAQDTFIIDQKLPSSVQRMSLVAFICLGAIIVNAIQSPIFLAFACPLILFYWAIQHFYRRSSIELQRIESATRSPYLSHLSNTLCSLVTLRAFNEESRLTNQFCDHLDANSTALLLLQSSSRWLSVSLDMAGSVIVFASVISCFIGFNSDGTTAGETFGLALNYSLLVPIYLAWVVKFMTELENCLNAVERIVEYTELDHEDLFEESDDDFEDINEFDLKFEKLSLSHGDILRPVVHNVNFQIPQGQRVALVGRSGSGKSTIINSLSGMSRIVQGDIKIGNISLSSVSILNLRKIIKTLPQDVHVFGGTIKDILDPNKEYEIQDIRRVLDDLEIKDQDLDSEVESFGDNLSMALKQELVIAQAILSQPKVLVMDEATSAIEDDRLMIAKLFKICKNLNITLISVVHRLSNISSYDRVLVIGDGRVLEDGKPLELLKKPMGFFSSLYRNSI